MSKVVDIRNALNTLIETALTGKKYQKLSDSYDTPDNAGVMLERGYSVAYGPANRLTADFCNGTMIRIHRQFQIILTHIYTANLDPERREVMENDLLDDHFLVAASLEKEVTLQGVCTSSYFDFDNGLEYIIADSKQFIIIVMTIIVQYDEETS